MDKQPKALYLLNFVSMWENFSYYGMRALLVLYMVSALGYSDESALALYALYTTFVELGGVAGGAVADRYLGLKRAIIFGGIVIATGHITMAFSTSEPSLFLSLGLIVLGTSLFRSNVAAFLGHFYEENDPRRDAGYTLYYAGINVGGFLATIACAVVAERYGWHAGFSLAAFGMLLGLCVLIFCSSILGSKGGKVTSAKRESIREAVASVPKMKIFALYIGFIVLFYACEEQLGSTLILFGERHVDRSTIFGTIPAASLITCNPLTILLFGPLVVNLPYRGFTKIGISFFLLGMAFLVLYVASYFTSQGDMVPLAFALFSIFLISLGELLLGPTVFALASDIAPRSLSGVTMGAVGLGYSLANLCSGVLSQLMAVSKQADSLQVYMNGFLVIIILAFSLSLLLLMMREKANRPDLAMK